VRLHCLGYPVQHPRDRKEARAPAEDARSGSSGGAFIIYQVTNELRQHAPMFDGVKSEYFLQNIPPMFITVFSKANNARNGHAAHAAVASARVPVNQSA
jgi:hypothetical protein